MKTLLELLEDNKKSLTDRDIEFIKMIIEENDYIYIARQYGLTRERVKQIAQRAIRRISIDLEQISTAIIELRKKEYNLTLREQIIVAKEKELQIASIASNTRLKYPDEFYLNIDEFYAKADISVRLYNQLRYNWGTIAELMEALKNDRLAFIKNRNAGRKTARELEDILRSYGIEMKLT